ncbi:MAG: cytochrome b/b6 domain-containing protein [Acidobacteriota bacterium]|nr:cytochrome b/b6 domain-containing protein [Acidobacteriota bacterium]
MPEKTESGFVVRFSKWTRLQHSLVIVLFGLLLLTGLPQKWPYVEMSRWVVDMLGGVFLVRWLHRAAGIVFGVLVVAHVVGAVMTLARRRGQPTMFFSIDDFKDAIQTMRYYLGRAESQPRFGRFDFRQKFEYWGMLFGSAIMLVTGFVLLFPIVTARLLPADLIPAAKVMHSNEALLAFLIILVWHMYGAILNPEVFPLDTSIFTGKISKKRLKHEHRLEYDERFKEP